MTLSLSFRNLRCSATVLAIALLFTACVATRAQKPGETVAVTDENPVVPAYPPPRSPTATYTPSPPAYIPPATWTPWPTMPPVTPSETPSPTPWPTLTPTRTPLPTITPGAPVGLSPSGPWRLLADMDHLWAFNADGSGLSRLYDFAPGQNSTRITAAPSGGRAVFYTTSNGRTGADLTLHIVTLPDGAIRTVAHLVPAGDMPEGGLGDPLFEAVRALGFGPAWSPDGRRLAFVSAQDGISADLYLYAVDDGSVTRLTDEPSHAFNPSWSPDGRIIVMLSASGFGTGAGFGMTGIWAVPADGSGARLLYVPEHESEIVLGWSAPDTFLVAEGNSTCGMSNLRAYHLSTGTQDVLRAGSFNSAAYSPAAGTVLLLVNCSIGREVHDLPAIYLLRVSDGQTRRVYTYPDESGGPTDITWSQDAGLFLVSFGSSGKLLAFTPAGDPARLPDFQLRIGDPSYLAVVPIGAAWAVTSGFLSSPSGVWIAVGEGEPMAIYSGPAHRAAWSPDGQTLFFLGGAASEQGLYVARAPEFRPVLLSTEMFLTIYLGSVTETWVTP